MKRILVTGASGFVGRHLVPALARSGHAPVALVRDPHRRAALDRLFGDIETRDLAALPDSAGGERFDAVVPLAGIADAHGGSGAGAGAIMAANAGLTGTIARFAAASGTPRLIFVSSILALGPNHAARPLDDDTPPAPDTAYGRSKLAAEDHVAAFADAGGLGVSLRPPLVVGPDAGGNWARLMRLADTGWPLPFAAIRNRRSLLPVDMLGRAILTLIDAPANGGLSGRYALADPRPVSLAETVARLRSGMGRPPRLVPFPGASLALAGRLTGRARLLRALTGDLAVRPDRFLSTFDFAPETAIGAAIEACGRAYAQRGSP